MATLTPNRPDERFKVLVFPEREAYSTMPSASSANGLQVLYILLLLPGVFVSLMAMGIYPPLSSRLPMAIMLGLFLVPSMMHLINFIRRRPGANPRRGPALLVTAACALLLLGASLFLNGSMDHSPVHEVRTKVMRKSILYGRATQYDIDVASWRPGHDVEHLFVTSAVYHRAVVGGNVAVELHDGYLGLPWRGRISPQ